MQVQQRQHLGDLRRLPCPRRQDRRAEPATFPGLDVDALVVDPRGFHRHRTRGGQHLAFAVITIAYHQPIPVLVDLAGMSIDIGGHLGPQRRCEHCPCAVAHDLSSNDPPAVPFSLDASASWTTLSMGVPSRTSAPTPALDQTYLDFQIILGKVRPFTSPGRGPSTSSDHCSLRRWRRGCPLEATTRYRVLLRGIRMTFQQGHAAPTRGVLAAPGRQSRWVGATPSVPVTPPRPAATSARAAAHD